MTVGTRVNSTVGVKTSNDSNGLVVERDTSNVGFSPFKVESVKAVVTSSTLLPGDAGVVTISGNVTHTVVMPLASACAGSTWVVRPTSNHAHILTGSQEAQGTRVFGNISSAAGSRLTLSGSTGAAVVFFSTGLNFVVVGAMSGSAPFTINGN